MTDRDRRHILERRALFISSSLALLSCNPKTPPAAPIGTSPTEVTIPEKKPTATPDELVATAPPERPEAPRTEPTMDIPAGVSERTRENYERTFKTVRTQLAALQAAEQKLPSACDVNRSSCEATFRHVADLLLDYHQSMRFSYVCPGSSEEAKAFHSLQSRLTRDVQARHAALVQELEKALSDGGADGKKEWARIEQEAAASRPQVCLSFACEDW